MIFERKPMSPALGAYFGVYQLKKKQVAIRKWELQLRNFPVNIFTDNRDDLSREFLRRDSHTRTYVHTRSLFICLFLDIAQVFGIEEASIQF